MSRAAERIILTLSAGNKPPGRADTALVSAPMVLAPGNTSKDPLRPGKRNQPKSLVSCPLCGTPDVAPLLRESDKAYHRCSLCALSFLDPTHHLSREDEEKHYRRHENDVNDPGYQKFVEPLVAAITSRLKEPSTGLDYGCGPGPVAAHLLSSSGHQIAYYDPFFRPNHEALTRSYDFVIVSEVAEHFHRPGKEFDRLARLLKPGGILGIMTQLLTPQVDFKQWYYRRDPTHVCFYSTETFEWISDRFGFDAPKFSSDRVIVLTKKLT